MRRPPLPPGRSSHVQSSGRNAASFVLRLNRRPGEALVGRQALKGVVAGVAAGRGQAHMEVEGVGAVGGREGTEGRREGAERAVIDGRTAPVHVLVEREVQLRGKRRAARTRAVE